MGYDPVTIADRAAEEVIRAAIARAIRTTASTAKSTASIAGTSPLTWVIDPIDGTKSFILGQLHWATLIALHDGTRPVVGVVASAVRGRDVPRVAGRPRAMAARQASSARLRTRRCAKSKMRSSRRPTRDTSGRPATARRRTTRSPASARLTRFGGDCYCYTQLAMGFVDMVVETGLQPYDVQALIPLVEAAGGVITDWSGGPCDQGGDVFACGDRELHAKVLKRLS